MTLILIGLGLILFICWWDGRYPPLSPKRREPDMARPNAQEILNKYASRQGWTDYTQLDLTISYIQSELDDAYELIGKDAGDRFESFIKGVADQENAESEELWQ